MFLILVKFALAIGIPIILYSLMQTWKFRSIRHIPGPKGLPILGNLLEFHQLSDLLAFTTHMIKTYGPVSKFHVGPSVTWLLVADREMIEYFLRSTKYISKSVNYKFTIPWMGKGLLTSTGENWYNSRKLIMPAFYAKPLQEYLHVFNSATDTFIKILQQHIDKGAIDILDYVTCLTLDIGCDTTMGVNIDSQRNPNSAFIKAVHRATRIIVERAISIWKYFDFLFWFSHDYTVHKEALQVLHKFTDDVIQTRRQQLMQNNELLADKLDTDMDSNKIMLDLLLKSTINGARLTEERMRYLVSELIFAAHDTTATAISLMFYELAKRPKIQERLVEELHAVFGNDATRPVTYQDLCQLKYMDAVVKESLRYNAPVPFVGRQLLEDVEYKGTVFPKGLQLLLIFYGIHRNGDIFDDPHSFNPDRFLNDSVIKPYTFLPFSAGTRNCAGQKYAQYELKVVLAKCLRHFEFICAEPEEELKFAYHLVIKSLNGVRIGLKRRYF